MEDDTAPAPPRTADAIARGKNRTSFSIAALTAGIGFTFFMAGFAHAEPMISTARTVSEDGLFQLAAFADQRLLFGVLTFGFSLAAAGVWHRSFRAVRNARHPSRH
ncbi:hypothetical protein J2T09_004803 [Neorhizobium huautlense]|uniref:DUF1206 domain-containing protein n=1 Tax=Neorhizobium huautlense TaxID=67774 RepID=A0ABT9PZW7_9HYPH|nr:hypothetical protein [Neorhizobium huautlense]MDP9840023.1 hypothetical protein [Neorhizobium huautlense]